MRAETPVLAVLVLVVHVHGFCSNPRLPHCRSQARNSARQSGGCKYPELWFIPKRTDTSCKQQGKAEILEILEDSVRVTPKVVKVPGCFVVEMTVRVLDVTRFFPSSYFGKVEYQWWNFPDFEKLQCRDAADNGCGGYGNNCYYCDICDSLKKLDSEAKVVEDGIVDQLEGLECPVGPGLFRLRRQFCMRDWNALDADGDCKLDFLEDHSIQDYEKAFKAIKQIGWGTLIAKFKLAYNATATQTQKRLGKESQIQQAVKDEVNRRVSQNGLRGLRGMTIPQFIDFYSQYRKDLWHKADYLPWLLLNNEVACLKISFDVCDSPPVPLFVPAYLRKSYAGQDWMCPRN